jgi:hypothetical protein
MKLVLTFEIPEDDEPGYADMWARGILNDGEEFLEYGGGTLISAETVDAFDAIVENITVGGDLMAKLTKDEKDSASGMAEGLLDIIGDVYLTTVPEWLDDQEHGDILQKIDNDEKFAKAFEAEVFKELRRLLS